MRDRGRSRYEHAGVSYLSSFPGATQLVVRHAGCAFSGQNSCLLACRGRPVTLGAGRGGRDRAARGVWPHSHSPRLPFNHALGQSVVSIALFAFQLFASRGASATSPPGGDGRWPLMMMMTTALVFGRALGRNLSGGLHHLDAGTGATLNYNWGYLFRLHMQARGEKSETVEKEKAKKRKKEKKEERALSSSFDHIGKCRWRCPGSPFIVLRRYVLYIDTYVQRRRRLHAASEPLESAETVFPLLIGTTVSTPYPTMRIPTVGGVAVRWRRRVQKMCNVPAR